RREPPLRASADSDDVAVRLRLGEEYVTSKTAREPRGEERCRDTHLPALPEEHPSCPQERRPRMSCSIDTRGALRLSKRLGRRQLSRQKDAIEIAHARGR